MRGAGQVAWWRAKKHLDHEAQRVSYAEGAGNDGGQGQAIPAEVVTAGKNGFGKEHFFGKKAIEQWYTSHGCRRHHGKSRCNRHAAVKPREPAQVACARFVVDDAGGHEPRSLDSGMVDYLEDGRHQRQLAV